MFWAGMVVFAVVAAFVWSVWIRARTAVKATSASVAVYYFHGSIRCEKCLEIERISREIVLSFYADDIVAGRVKWDSVNYELPKNRHFLDDFNLGLPSLAVECRKNGVVRRTVLTNTWEKVEVQEDLEDYVINGIECFRDGQEGVSVQQASRP